MNQLQQWTSKLKGVISAFKRDQPHLKSLLEQEDTSPWTWPVTQVSMTSLVKFLGRFVQMPPWYVKISFSTHYNCQIEIRTITNLPLKHVQRSNPSWSLRRQIAFMCNLDLSQKQWSKSKFYPNTVYKV